MSKFHVLVTRPSPAGEELCNLIRQCGGVATHFPTIEFAPPQDLSAYQRAIASLGTQDWLIFISPQAVYSSIPAIRSAWPHFPPKVRLAAIGSGTAKALKEAGYRVATQPTAEWSSESLLDLPEFQEVDGKNITLVRGEGGRDLLAKTFSSRGAKVSHVIAYQRIIPKAAPKLYCDLLKTRKIDAIVCTSFEGVRNFKTLLGTTNWPYIKGIPLIVVSERIKSLAHDLEFQPIWVAHNASNEVILELLLQRENELCQMKQMKS